MSTGVVVQSEQGSPAGIDVERPSAARIYDYQLGGSHNFAADRQVAEQMAMLYPQVTQIAQANRAFLRRAVEHLVGAGVRQFLDIGSGIPTVGHVHEIAQHTAPDARVVYVDIDPVAVAHSHEILAGNERTAAVQADVRDPERIVTAPEVRALLDFDQPVAVLVLALFHFIPDAQDPAAILDALTAPLAPGSYLVMSHATEDEQGDTTQGRELYKRSGIELTLRSRPQVEALFAGFDLVDPGVVWLPQWRPESPGDLFCDSPASSAGYAGVGRKT